MLELQEVPLKSTAYGTSGQLTIESRALIGMSLERIPGALVPAGELGLAPACYTQDARFGGGGYTDPRIANDVGAPPRRS